MFRFMLPQRLSQHSGWFKPHVGLRAKMALLVVVGCLSLIGLFGYLGTAALEENVQRTLHERVVLAQTTARHIDAVLTIVESVLMESATQEFWDDPERADSALAHTSRRLGFLASRVFLLDHTGHIRAANPPLTSTVSFEQFTAVTAVLNGQSFAVSRYTRPLDSAGSSTIAVVPIQDESGKVPYVLLVSLNLTSPELRTFTQPIGLGETGYMDLVDLSGTILASTRAERIGSSSDHRDSLPAMIREQSARVSTCHNCHIATALGPAREVLAFAPLERAQWGIAVRQSEHEVFAATRLLQIRIFILLIIVIAGALILVILTTRSVIAPVQALTTATRRIAQGDLETPLQTHGQDEIGVLARSFDGMRARLQDSMAEIRAWNRELNARVRERTAECERARADIEQLYIELRGEEHARRELLHRIISAQEEERKRIARELHDGTSQILIGMVYRLERAAEMIARGKLRTSETRALLAQLLELTQMARAEVNYVILNLRPLLLDQLGLIPALRSYAEERFAESGLSWNIRIIGESRRLAPQVEAALFRAAQEAINNVVRHARARRTDFVFEYFDDHMRVQISDDGQGFEPTRIEFSRDGAAGLGLLSMEERMRAVGGEFELRSAPGAGTTVTLTARVDGAA
ncbi:MAG: HAMP domain-containing protein [Chloroflexota bacterium]